MHNIPVAVAKTCCIRTKSIDVDASVVCFPSGRVEYSVHILRSTPGQVFKISVQAIFFAQERQKGLSKMAVFYSNKPTVEGVPAGDAPYTGRSFPSDDAIYGVDDFVPTGGVARVAYL